jgi:uncharacterized repeat protein (TIGR03803 family)
MRNKRSFTGSNTRFWRQWQSLVLALVIILGITLTSASQAQTFTTLYSFQGGTDGFLPASGLIFDPAGSLYGVTFRGGDSNCDHGLSCGVIFEIEASGTETILHRFTGRADGAYPTGSLARDLAGNLYGATFYGGLPGCRLNTTKGCGIIFKLDKSGALSVLHTFAGFTDGANPNGSLILDAAGNLYGTTASGGPLNQGTVFELDTKGFLTVLHAFAGKSDGSQPIAGVTRDSTGNLLGTTSVGGTRYFSSGTAFKLDPAGQETVLHTFQPNGVDGNFPYAGLIPFGQDLYGTTSSGGPSSFGTVFKLDKAGNETVLYSFLGGSDGRYPQNSGVVHDGSGNLYGTTENGGDANDDGIVFQLDPIGAETVLHRFSGKDGSRPMAGVITDSAGNLYGTTYEGGAFGNGTVFKITP